MNSVFNDFIDWLRQPFDTQMNAFKWVLFVGLLFIIVWFWHIVLLDIE